MIPNDLRDLVVEACALPYCPDCVRARLVGFLSTGSSPELPHHEAISVTKSMWYLFTISVVNANYQWKRRPGGSQLYKNRLSLIRQNLDQIMREHHHHHDDDPRE